jgi:hypothetical protein
LYNDHGGTESESESEIDDVQKGKLQNYSCFRSCGIRSTQDRYFRTLRKSHREPVAIREQQSMAVSVPPRNKIDVESSRGEEREREREKG